MQPFQSHGTVRSPTFPTCLLAPLAPASNSFASGAGGFASTNPIGHDRPAIGSFCGPAAKERMSDGGSGSSSPAVASGASASGASGAVEPNPHLAVIERYKKKAEDAREAEAQRKRVEEDIASQKVTQQAVVDNEVNLHHIILGMRKRLQERAAHLLRLFAHSPLCRKEAPGRAGGRGKVPR